MSKTKLTRLIIIITLSIVTFLLASFSYHNEVKGAGILGGERYISRIEIQGNEIIEEDIIKNVIQAKKGDKITSELLNEDLKSIKNLGYFENVEVSMPFYIDGLKVIYRVQENPKLNSVKLIGNTLIEEDILLEKINFRLDEIVNIQTLKRNLSELKQIYINEGYILVEISDYDLSSDGDLTIKINEKKIESIKIIGSNNIREEIVYNYIDLKEGDKPNINHLQENIFELENSNLFYDVNYKFEEESLILKIEEIENTFDFGYAIAYNTDSGWRGRVFGEELNFRGKGQQIKGEIQFGDVEKYQLEFYEPFLWERRIGMNIETYLKKENSEKENLEFNKKNIGFNVIFDYTIENWDLDLGFSYEQLYEKSDSSTESSFKTKENLTNINLTSKKNEIKSVVYEEYIIDDSYLLRNEGYALEHKLEYGGFNIDKDYLKIDSNGLMYIRDNLFNNNNNWILNYHLGFLLGDNKSEFMKYKLGGPNNLRGFSKNKFIGDSIINLNAEYRILFNEFLEGVLFLDSGSVWEDNFDMDNFKYSAGLGVRALFPVGELRLDYAIQSEDSKLHFSIGRFF